MATGFANEMAELLARVSRVDRCASGHLPSELSAQVAFQKQQELDESKRTIKAWRAKKKTEKSTRTIANWQHIRSGILKRDGYVCRICGADPCEAQMHVHHVDWDRSNNTSRNLVTLCSDCHQGIHLHGYRPDGADDEPWGDRGRRED